MGLLLGLLEMLDSLAHLSWLHHTAEQRWWLLPHRRRAGPLARRAVQYRQWEHGHKCCGKQYSLDIQLHWCTTAWIGCRRQSFRGWCPDQNGYCWAQIDKSHECFSEDNVEKGWRVNYVGFSWSCFASNSMTKTLPSAIERGYSYSSPSWFKVASLQRKGWDKNLSMGVSRLQFSRAN